MNNTYSCGRQISVNENVPTLYEVIRCTDVESDVFY